MLFINDNGKNHGKLHQDILRVPTKDGSIVYICAAQLGEIKSHER